MTGPAGSALRVLALEPYFGGSHRAFLEQWTAHSRHGFELLTLPARHWKWRMRHAAVTFAAEIRGRVDGGGPPPWDIVFATDMLSLAELRGLVPPAIAALPTVLYFHESQLDYPDRRPHDGDLHFAFTNLTSALAADEVWFNSNFHHETFLDGVHRLLRRMPERRLDDEVERLRARCRVEPPGVEPSSTTASGEAAKRRGEGPLHVVWAARWEHDKQPETFFRAVRGALAAGAELRLSVLGQAFRDVPQCFEQARRELAGVVVDWGFQPRQRYLEILAGADVFVSTAGHEFFGLAAVEAMVRGCAVLLPDRLSYPELVERDGRWLWRDEQELVARLIELAGPRPGRARAAADRQAASRLAGSAVRRFGWRARAPALDAGLERVARSLTAIGCSDAGPVPDPRGRGGPALRSDESHLALPRRAARHPSSARGSRSASAG